VFRAGGVGADVAFRDESGGHRWQRIPPNEKRGRVHTSTITVAVLPDPTEAQVRIDPRDLEWSTCRGSGPGGQHRNKTESAVQITHIPTKLQVRVEDGRSQHHNRQLALELLRSRLWAVEQEKVVSARADDRKRQVGSGMRGDKRRTIRAQDGQVNDHVTGKTWRYKDYIRGNWD
jgi:peptide chain release factor 1